MIINPEFRKHFDELEKVHLNLREKINAYPEKDEELEARLSSDIKIVEPWRVNIMDQLGEITLNLNPEEKKQYQDFIEHSKYFQIGQEAPFYWRIINKPEGYAGDAVMMEIIYRNMFEGENNFGMFLHKQAVLSDACQAVRNRREFLKDQIIDKGSGKILSIAAGPAMEIQDVLVMNPNGNTYQFHAFDHDIKTIRKVSREVNDSRLQYMVGNAFHLIKGKTQVAIPRNLMLDYCNPRNDTKGFGMILFPFKYSTDRLKKEDYDLVYSAGLYDYIKTFPEDHNKGTIALTRNLFELVKPGGSLVIGNFSPNNPLDLRFPMEFVYDWQLIHRDEQQMYVFAQGISQSQIKSMEVLAEPLGINYFLKIDKK
jgi:SAM-dependent methyltransferase